MKRIFHISNRVEIPETGKPTAGGLDEAIADAPEGMMNVRFGWSGKTVADDLPSLDETVQVTRKGATLYITYDLRKTDLMGFYSSTANGIIWPANHYREDIAKQGFENRYIYQGEERDARDDIATYFKVNKEVAELAKNYIEGGDTVIVHDYHFIPLASHLDPGTPIGYFHHTPILNADLLETFDRPQQRFFQQLYEHFYNYDFVGLQTKSDVAALHSVIGNTNLKQADFFETQPFSTTPDSIGRRTQFGAFPVAGNAPKYTEMAKAWSGHKSVLEYIEENAGGSLDMMSVERRDYSKGLIPKVMGVGSWLRNFGTDGSRIHLVQIAPKGREDVPAYIRESLQIETAVETVREIFGDVIHLDGGKVERGMHLGMARHSSSALVTPTRDGMNLYVTEYLAAQIGREDPGVAIVSKFAGVASIYGDSLIRVDPRKPSSIAEGIQRARLLTREERQDMLERATELGKFFNNTRWQSSLIEATRSAAQPRLDGI
jgi:trehalose 6-phosphate synthase